jgi:ADP-ribose pyrophosphatase YjhB (NUDIX family)
MSGDIRVLAICVFREGDRILVAGGTDPANGAPFYRPLGGGVEFGERAEIALRREISEELGGTIEEPRLLGVLENVFEYDGRPRHEIVFVFDARFSDPSWYERTELPVTEAGTGWRAALDPGRDARVGSGTSRARGPVVAAPGAGRSPRCRMLSTSLEAPGGQRMRGTPWVGSDSTHFTLDRPETGEKPAPYRSPNQHRRAPSMPVSPNPATPASTDAQRSSHAAASRANVRGGRECR